MKEVDLVQAKPSRQEVAYQYTRQLVSIYPSSDGRQVPGATRGLPLARWTTSARPGLHRAMGMEDEVW